MPVNVAAALDHADLVRSIGTLRGELTEALDALQEMAWHHCSRLGTEPPSSRRDCEVAAIKLLARHGRCEIVSEGEGRVVARWTS